MKTLLRRLLPLLLLLVASIVCSPASAASCSVSSSGLAFGGYDPVSATATTGTGSINVACTPDCPVIVCLGMTATVSLNTGSSGTFTARTMQQGGAPLTYNLYTLAGTGAPIFGNGSGGSVTVTYCVAGFLFPCNGATYTGTSGQLIAIPVFGQIAAAQNVASGPYSDGLTATVTF